MVTQKKCARKEQSVLCSVKWIRLDQERSQRSDYFLCSELPSNIGTMTSTKPVQDKYMTSTMVWKSFDCSDGFFYREVLNKDDSDLSALGGIRYYISKKSCPISKVYFLGLYSVCSGRYQVLYIQEVLSNFYSMHPRTLKCMLWAISSTSTPSSPLQYR